MRSLISYDDLTDSTPSKAQNGDKNSRQAHSRKKSRHSAGNSNSKVHSTQPQKRQPTVSSESKSHNFKYGIQEESRELTHTEIWDDTALIEAWNAAAEEFETLNGPEKSWKTEPVHKSPLWYNIPPKQKDTDTSEAISTMMPSIPASLAAHFELSEDMEVEETDNEDEDEDEENSRPIDFETFVPQHDPSLSLHQPVSDETTFLQLFPPPQSSSSVSADQAFQNATGAWYWAGYWTGIYHAMSRPKTKTRRSQGRDNGDHEQEPESEDVTEDTNLQIPPTGTIADQTDLIPT